MLDTVFGLPIHPLIVHATTVIVPAAAIAVLLAAVWARFHRWSRWLPLGLAAAALVLTPLSTESGESLEHRVEHSQLIEQHSELAEGLLPWVIGLLVAAALLAVVMRRERALPAQSASSARDSQTTAAKPSARLPRALLVAAALLAIVAAAGTTVQVVRIGHSGAQAAWSDAVSQTPAPPASGGDGDGDGDGS